MIVKWLCFLSHKNKLYSLRVIMGRELMIWYAYFDAI